MQVDVGTIIDLARSRCWSLLHITLNLNPRRSLLLYMSAVCVAILVPLTMIMEPTAVTIAMQMSISKPGFTWWLLGNSVLAYFVNLTK
jgi:hypothetical protein